MTTRLHQTQQDFHGYEKEHRYSNEEYFEREQRMKGIELELSAVVANNEKFQREINLLNEDLTKCRLDLDQVEKSDLVHKERVSFIRIKVSLWKKLNLSFKLIQSIDESKIYKKKLALIGDCFKTVVRKVKSNIDFVFLTSSSFEPSSFILGVRHK